MDNVGPLLYDLRNFLANAAQMLDEMKTERTASGIGWTDYNQEQRETLTALMSRIDALPQPDPVSDAA